MFTRIKESYYSFKTPVRKPTIQNKLDDHKNELDDRYHGKKITVRPGVRIIVVLPLMLTFTYILTELTSLGGLASVFIAGFVGYLISELGDRIFKHVPFYRLNPYFGNRIEEAAKSLKGVKK